MPLGSKRGMQLIGALSEARIVGRYSAVGWARVVDPAARARRPVSRGHRYLGSLAIWEFPGGVAAQSANAARRLSTFAPEFRAKACCAIANQTNITDSRGPTAPRRRWWANRRPRSPGRAWRITSSSKPADAPAKLVIPGNHDIPLFDLAARLFAPYARYRRAFGPDLEPVHDSAQLLAIGVNTTRRYRHVDGEISMAQIERVATRVERASPTQLRIVVTHQPVYVTHAEDEKNLLHGRDHAIGKWAAAGVDLILGGHIHRPFACKLPKRLTGVARTVWLIQAGTALSRRIRSDAGNSVNLIRYRGLASQRSCTYERWDYVESSQTFMLVDIQELTG